MIKVDGRVLKDSLELRYAEGRGYHVRAKQHLVAGSIVLEEKPCGVALSPSAAEEQCRACLTILPPKLRKDPIKCTRCNKAWYCSQRCVKADNSRHGPSGECNLLQDSATMKELGTFARETCLAMRLLQCMRGEPPFQSNWEKFIGPQAGEDAHTLCVAAKALGKATEAAVAEGLAGAVAREEKAAAEAVCQVFTNALELLPSLPVACACNAQAIHTGQPPAAMYSLISRLNHSCRANTAYHFKAGGAVVVRAVVDIEPDEELCISYLDPIQPFARRQEDLQQRFCFACSCERCTSEQRMLKRNADSADALRDGASSAGADKIAGQQNGSAADVPRGPAWFLSALAPGADEAEIESCLAKLTLQAREEFVLQGNATAAWTALEPGVLQAVEMGVHPYHHRCLELYACLASACRVCAKTGAGRVALRRAAMWMLLQAGAVEAVLAVGEYGAMPAAARNWSEAGGLLCEVLAAELAYLKCTPAKGTPPPSDTSTSPEQSKARDSSQCSTQANGEGLETVRAEEDGPLNPSETAGTKGQKRGEPQGSELPSKAARQPQAEGSCRASKRARIAAACSGEQQVRPRAVQWPDVLQAASEERQPCSKAPRKSVPEPPADFAAGVCSAWAALCACRQPAKESGECASVRQPWPDDCPDLQTLAGPAGFLSCSQPLSANLELREALQKELNSPGQAERDLQRLQHVGTGAILCVAHATSLLKVTAGYAHPTSEANMFSAFFAGLPYSIASVISRTASQLSC